MCCTLTTTFLFSFLTHIDECTSIDSRITIVAFINENIYNNVAMFCKFMRLKNKVIRVIRFWSDNAEFSAQCGKSDYPSDKSRF